MLVLAALLGATYGMHQRANAAPVQATWQQGVVADASTDPFPISLAATTPAPRACAKAAPTTAEGFDSMFRALPVAQWGAADVGITVPLADGRSVWLWGDTMSTGRFAHSTAITQDGGCLHVSNGGAQLLPNDGEKFYWIEYAFTHGESSMVIAAEEIVADPKAEWGFHYTGFNRYAEVTVDQAGDLHFEGWIHRSKQPMAARADDLELFAGGQVGYSPRRHPEFALASGKTLLTEARNWTDGKVHPLDTYRPVFSEVNLSPEDVEARVLYRLEGRR